MKLPLSWLAEFVELPKSISISDIATGFTKVGFEIESIFNPADRIKGPLVVGKVLSIEELGGHKKPIRHVGLDCAENRTRYVICGATNFVEGDLVVVALPGAVLAGNFAISARETYGKTSNGMICSSKELGLGDDHSGIIVLDSHAKIGGSALKALGADDPVLDIVVNPDRGYAMSVRGAARELAVAIGLKFKDVSSSSLISSLDKKKKRGKITPVLISDKTGADQIYLRSLSNVDPFRPTPPWMARRLSQAGMRPISIVVDITNYVMLELGQPLHAFDSAKISGTLKVARAGKFTELVTLDKVKRKLAKDNLLIVDDKKVLALAGTMGGLDSEVSEFTVGITLEAAHFEPVSVARNSRCHNLSSEASRRFERGVDPALAEVASARAALLLIEYAGAIYNGASSKTSAIKRRSITIAASDISTLIGTTYRDKEIERSLKAIGAGMRKRGKKWIVTPPSWRPDLNDLPDLAEEVARFFGYDRIPSQLPSVKLASTGITGLTALQKRRRAMTLKLANRGLVEVHNYPFVSQSQMELFGFAGDRAKTFKIANPMSDEYPFLRTHLTPGLIATAARNLARGEKSVALFESGSIFRDVEKLNSPGEISVKKRPTAAQIEQIYQSVPKQPLHIAGVIAGEITNSGWWGKGRSVEWSDAVDLVRELIEESGNNYSIEAVDLAPWHPGRCAEFRVEGKAVAHAGQIHPRITSALSLPEATAAFAVIVDGLSYPDGFKARPISSMPAAIQDISLFVDQKVPAEGVQAALAEGAGELLESIQLFDRYQKEGESQVSLAFSLVFRAPDRTLTAEEVSELRLKAGALAGRKFGAQIRA